MRQASLAVADLELTYAGASYYDKTRALELGELSPDGIELDYVRFEHVGELFRAMAQTPERFSAAEMSLSTLAMLISRGDDRLVGIPVFPSKAFRHSQVYVNVDSGIEKPEDLRGRRVAVPEYQMTAAVWIRAFLEHDYGVSPREIHWLTGGLVTPQYEERLHHDAPPGVTIDLIPQGRTLLEMLDSGEIDGLTTAQQPQTFTAGSGRVRRLFPDYRSVEEDYLRRTGYFPIMHTVVVQRELYETNRWVAVALLEAFEKAKHLARARLRNLDTLAIMHPWIAAELEELKEPFGSFGGDPFAYGISPNRHVIDALLGYSYEQGLSDRKVTVEDIYAAETLDWAPPPAVGEPPA
jgi:4,5-dihydroxyphthalate decarboxylase